jgi:hypothetical protein
MDTAIGRVRTRYVRPAWEAEELVSVVQVD